MKSSRDGLISALADAFLSGTWDLEGMVKRAGCVLGKRYRWIRPMARRVLAAFEGGERIRAARLAEFLRNDDGFRRAFERGDLSIHFARWAAPVMAPAPGPPASWKVPAIATPEELASFLEVEPGEL